jgi:hypothetical protein
MKNIFLLLIFVISTSVTIEGNILQYENKHYVVTDTTDLSDSSIVKDTNTLVFCKKDTIFYKWSNSSWVKIDKKEALRRIMAWHTKRYLLKDK